MVRTNEDRRRTDSIELRKRTVINEQLHNAHCETAPTRFRTSAHRHPLFRDQETGTERPAREVRFYVASDSQSEVGDRERRSDVNLRVDRWLCSARPKNLPAEG